MGEEKPGRKFDDFTKALVYFYLKDYKTSLIYVKKAEHLGVDVNPDFKKDLLKKLEEKTAIPSPLYSV